MVAGQQQQPPPNLVISGAPLQPEFGGGGGVSNAGRMANHPIVVAGGTTSPDAAQYATVNAPLILVSPMCFTDIVAPGSSWTTFHFTHVERQWFRLIQCCGTRLSDELPCCSRISRAMARQVRQLTAACRRPLRAVAMQLAPTIALQVLHFNSALGKIAQSLLHCCTLVVHLPVLCCLHVLSEGHPFCTLYVVHQLTCLGPVLQGRTPPAWAGSQPAAAAATSCLTSTRHAP